MHPVSIKAKVQSLRSKGKTYSEILYSLKIRIPKSTLSEWCKDILLPEKYRLRIEQLSLNNLHKGRTVALAMSQIKKEDTLKKILNANKDLLTQLYAPKTAKIALVMLYLAEGAKKRQGSLSFGNSDPNIIKLFLKLLRLCYKIDEAKFRCTVQCRADQDISSLESFWHEVTNIPRTQFYSARIDPRSVGKISRHASYKGVCRIDYFSASVYNELIILGNMLSE